MGLAPRPDEFKRRKQVENVLWWLLPDGTDWLELIEVKQEGWLKNMQEKIEKEKSDEAEG